MNFIRRWSFSFRVKCLSCCCSTGIFMRGSADMLVREFLWILLILKVEDSVEKHQNSGGFIRRIPLTIGICNTELHSEPFFFQRTLTHSSSHKFIHFHFLIAEIHSFSLLITEIHSNSFFITEIHSSITINNLTINKGKTHFWCSLFSVTFYPYFLREFPVLPFKNGYVTSQYVYNNVKFTVLSHFC